MVKMKTIVCTDWYSVCIFLSVYVIRADVISMLITIYQNMNMETIEKWKKINKINEWCLIWSLNVVQKIPHFEWPVFMVCWMH